jgi:hypothetical protein
MTIFDDWHGWGRSGESLQIGPLPWCKQICLYTVDARDGAAVMYVHAYFRSEDEACRALGVLDRLLEPPA